MIDSEYQKILTFFTCETNFMLLFYLDRYFLMRTQCVLGTFCCLTEKESTHVFRANIYLHTMQCIGLIIHLSKAIQIYSIY